MQDTSSPIRVLHVVTHMERGGLETLLMNYYRCMDRRQVQFDFLVHRPRTGAYEAEIRSLGGRIFRVPRLIPGSPFYTRTLTSVLLAHPEDGILHVHQDCLSGVSLRVAAGIGIPVRIAHCHNAGQDKNWKYPIKCLYRHTIHRYATDLFACGQTAGAWMFCGAPFRVWRNAVDTGIYRYDPQEAAQSRLLLGIPAGALVVGHVGRFSRVKNHAFLVDVFAALLAREPSAYLLLVGDGALRKSVQKRVDAHGLARRVIFTGEREDVPFLMQAMDVLAFPSLYEGFPLTLVEAQAAGLPCVVSEGVPKECDLTGRVVTVPLWMGPSAWAEQMLSCRRMGRPDGSGTIARAGYDIRRNAEALQAFYLKKAGRLWPEGRETYENKNVVPRTPRPGQSGGAYPSSDPAGHDGGEELQPPARVFP